MTVVAAAVAVCVPLQLSSLSSLLGFHLHLYLDGLLVVGGSGILVNTLAIPRLSLGADETIIIAIVYVVYDVYDKYDAYSVCGMYDVYGACGMFIV